MTSPLAVSIISE